MTRKLLAIGLLLALAACSDPRGTIEAAEAMGLKEVQPQGYAFFGCSEDDFYHTKFTAKSASGKQVTGVASAGLFFKGTTVRFN